MHKLIDQAIQEKADATGSVEDEELGVDDDNDDEESAIVVDNDDDDRKPPAKVKHSYSPKCLFLNSRSTVGSNNQNNNLHELKLKNGSQLKLQKR